MNIKDTLKKIIIDNQNRDFAVLWQRELEIPANTGKIVTVSGVRRSGKTSHLFSVIDKLLLSGFDRKNIVYINFEDERLSFDTEDLNYIIESYQELYPEQDLSKVFFFFDEIQEIDNFEKFINRIYESISKNIFITGSNAKLLSKEIATALRGRTITYEVYPFSFREYLAIFSKNENLDLNSSKDKAMIINHFNNFITVGGFPEAIKNEQEIREKILQEYFNVMLFKDLIERYEISQSSILKYFCRRVLALSGGEFSVNKVFNELKSQGYQLSKDLLYQFQENVNAIYLNIFVNKYSESIVKQENSFKKSYAIDHGFASSLDFKFAHDKGRIFENLVALELIKANKNIFYYKNSYECDFLTLDREKIKQAIQVCLEIDEEETKKREVKGVLGVAKKFNLTEGIILTLDYEEKITVDEVDILFIPAWKFFLQKDYLF